MCNSYDLSPRDPFCITFDCYFVSGFTEMTAGCSGCFMFHSPTKRLLTCHELMSNQNSHWLTWTWQCVDLQRRINLQENLKLIFIASSVFGLCGKCLLIHAPIRFRAQVHFTFGSKFHEWPADLSHFCMEGWDTIALKAHWEPRAPPSSKQPRFQALGHIPLR